MVSRFKGRTIKNFRIHEVPDDALIRRHLPRAVNSRVLCVRREFEWHRMQFRVPNDKEVPGGTKRLRTLRLVKACGNSSVKEVALFSSQRIKPLVKLKVLCWKDVRTNNVNNRLWKHVSSPQMQSEFLEVSYIQQHHLFDSLESAQE